MERTDAMNAAMTAASAPRRELTGAYIDWAAVLGGAVVATAIGGLFTTFGAALGLSTISAEPGEGSFNIWVLVTGLWLVVTLVVSFLAGGYIAGRMRRRLDDATSDEVSARDGINGLVVWALGILLTGWIAAGAIGGVASVAGTAATAVGSAVGGAAQGIGAAAGGAVQGVAQGAGQAASQAVSAAIPEDGNSDLLEYINGTLMRPAAEGLRQGAQQSTGATTPGTPSMDDAELARQSGIVLGNVLRTGEITEDDRAFLIAAVARRSGKTEAEVEARVDQAVKSLQETRKKAEDAAEAARVEAERLAQAAKDAAIVAAETARHSAILTAFVLTAAALVAGGAAVTGAVRGGRHRDEGRIWGGFSYRV